MNDHDWKQVALQAWQAPGWRDAAVEYHKHRLASASPPSIRTELLTSQAKREIWRAAGRCIRRRSPLDGLKTFLSWCDRHGISRGDALPIFETIVDKELAK
jgi:hypothetical protein